MNVRNEVKSYLMREGVTMHEVLAKLSVKYGWSSSISNLSCKLRRETLRYKEIVELADVLGYEIVCTIGIEHRDNNFILVFFFCGIVWASFFCMATNQKY